jgi:hypothetical protein
LLPPLSPPLLQPVSPLLSPPLLQPVSPLLSPPLSPLLSPPLLQPVSPPLSQVFPPLSVPGAGGCWHKGEQVPSQLVPLEGTHDPSASQVPAQE